MMPIRNRVSAGLVIAGGAIATIGCLQPWISETPPNVDVLTRNIFSTVHSAPLPGSDGQIITALALGSAVLGLVLLIGRMRTSYAIVVLMFGVIAGEAVLADWLDMSSTLQLYDDTYFFMAQIGAGIYITAVGVVMWEIGALISLWRPGPLPRSGSDAVIGAPSVEESGLPT
jgi:hypothetical protein